VNALKGLQAMKDNAQLARPLPLSLPAIDRKLSECRVVECDAPFYRYLWTRIQNAKFEDGQLFVQEWHGLNAWYVPTKARWRDPLPGDSANDYPCE
jgi:hypothetical protein